MTAASIQSPPLRAARPQPFNIKAQYPFEGKTTFTLLCAGTGITPMYQALWKLLGTAGDERKITMIYGNKSPDDILMKVRSRGTAVQHRHAAPPCGTAVWNAEWHRRVAPPWSVHRSGGQHMPLRPR